MAARRAIEAAGCELRFLSTSFPDSNLIEQAFAKLKGRRRQAEAHTFDAVAAATRASPDVITPEDACGLFADPS